MTQIPHTTRLREARDRSAGNRQLLSATYTADGERITKSDPMTGAHINSYGCVFHRKSISSSRAARPVDRPPGSSG